MSTPTSVDPPPRPYCVCGARNGWTNLSRTGGQQWVCADCERPSAMVYFQQASRNNPKMEKPQMVTNTKTTIDLNSLLGDLRDVLDAHLNGGKPAIETPAPSRAKVKPSKEVEPDEDEETTDDRKAELEAMTIAALRKLAIKKGFEPGDVNDAKKDEIVQSILDDEAEEAEAEDEDEDEEEAEEEEEEGDLTREQLEELGLVALKKLAKDEHGQTTASLKGLDKDSIIDIILGETEEEEEDEEEEEEDDEETEEEEADDDGEEEVTEDYLNGLSLNELRAKAKEWGYTVRPGMKRAQITDLFFGG